MNKISSQNYCRDVVREHDYNRYLLHFFVPRHVRRATLAMLALNHEWQSITAKSQDPTLRLIRLQWWRDEIEKIYDETPYASGPVLDEVYACNHLIKKELLLDIIHRYQQATQGQQADIEESLYNAITGTIPNDQHIQRFSKVLQKHDTLEPQAPFRALRLWLTHTSHCFCCLRRPAG